MTQRTILIADDDAEVRMALACRLKARGHTVIQCADGLGVIAKCRGKEVDAMVLDHSMPLGEGRKIAERIRSFSGAPIIFVSGRPREEFHDIVIRLPDMYYLSKPLQDGELGELLDRVLGVPECTAE